VAIVGSGFFTMSSVNERPDDTDENSYASPKEPVEATAESNSGPTRDDCATRRAIRYAFIQQVVVLIISALVLDGGDAIRLSATAAVLAWMPVAVIVAKQNRAGNSNLSKLHAAIIRHGFWIFFFGMCVLYHYGALPKHYYYFERKGLTPRLHVTSHE
jgi:hypothetical protein